MRVEAVHRRRLRACCFGWARDAFCVPCAAVRGHYLARHGAGGSAVTLIAGQIRDANSFYSDGAGARCGCGSPPSLALRPDDEEAIATLMRKAAQTCDLVITSGGASAGRLRLRDGARASRGARCSLTACRCAPGKAITFGLLGETPYLGLSVIPPLPMWGLRCLPARCSGPCRDTPKGLRPRQQALGSRTRYPSAKSGGSMIVPRWRVML